MISVKIEKTLIVDEKQFHTGSDIAFDYCQQHIICNIKDLNSDSLVGTNVEITHANGQKATMKLKTFAFDKITNVNYVYYD